MVFKEPPRFQDVPTCQETVYPQEETQAKIEPKRSKLHEQEDLHMKKMLETLEDKEKVVLDKVHKESQQWESCSIK